MRTEMIQAAISGGFKGRVGLGHGANHLKKGDFIRAEVLAADKGVVTLKTSNGHILNAKLDANTTFLPGDKVMLEVIAKENEIAQLSILREDEVLADSKTTKQGLTSGFEDRSLAPQAARLSQLNLPVNEETARAMRDLMTQNPRMSIDQAAFIASNKLMANEGLLKAALALLSGGEKTDAMLLKLVDMLSTSNMTALNQSGGNQNPSGTAPLMELFAQINDSVEGAKVPNNQNQNTLAETMKSIISQTDTILQSKNSMNNVQNVNDAQGSEKQSGHNNPITQGVGQVLNASGASGNPVQNIPLTNIPSPNISSPIDYIQSSTQNQQVITNSEILPSNPGSTNFSSQQIAPDIQPANVQLSQASPQIIAPETLPIQPESVPIQSLNPQAPSPIVNAQTPVPDSPPSAHSSLNSQLMELMSQLPEFRQTPTEALERFASTLIRVAGESAQLNPGDTEQLKLLLEKMFTRIERGDINAGARLHSAREEMFTRLSFLEEAIMRAAPAARAEMLEQTQRVMEHVRVLNNIDQFVYMQLPVILGNERKSAELYMFKKKGSKKVDPDNVNILLALDLQFMGRWEALLNIRDRDVSVKMDVSGQVEKEYFSAHTVLLHNMLAEADFRLVSSDISYKDEETTPLTALSVFDNYTKSNAKHIDFVV